MTHRTAPATPPRTGAAAEALAARLTEAEFTGLANRTLNTFRALLAEHHGDRAAAAGAFLAAHGPAAACFLLDLLAAPTA